MASPRQRRSTARAAWRRHATPSATRRDLGARLALAAVIALLLGAALAVDPGAEAAFDAPKRLLATGAIALAGAALLLFPAGEQRRWSWPALGTAQKLVLILLAIALCGASLAASWSPRRTLALGNLRVLLIVAALLPIGASRVLAAGRARVVAAAFLVASSVNALASLLERGGVVELFAVEAVAGRATTGAFVGNEGSLALVLALAAVAALAIALQARTAWLRVAAGLAAALPIAGLVVNPTLTALLAFLAGATFVVTALLGRRALLIAAALAGAAAVLAAGHAPLRARVLAAAEQTRAGDWDALLTYRFGPWAAAAEMVRERPALGFGPGTFGAEFVTHRLRAELRHGRRLVVPRETSTYAAAHCDYLQAFAEAGVVTGLAALAALAILLGALAVRLQRLAPEQRREAVVVLAVLITGAIGALTWFPSQQPASAAALLLALGRGWRLLAPGGDMPPPASAPRAALAGRVLALRGLCAVLLVGVVVLPEVRRYAAERELQRATQALKTLLRLPAGAAPHRAAVLDAIAARAAASATVLHGDARPLLAAAAADLLAQRPEQALDRYRSALAHGERAEIDLNVGRAFAIRDQRGEAFAAFVRAAWVSPALIPSMPLAARPLVTRELARLEAELRAGTLAAPPPPPPLRDPEQAP